MHMAGSHEKLVRCPGILHSGHTGRDLRNGPQLQDGAEDLAFRLHESIDSGGGRWWTSAEFTQIGLPNPGKPVWSKQHQLCSTFYTSGRTQEKRDQDRAVQTLRPTEPESIPRETSRLHGTKR
ncbi:hypothetical protein NDU88_005300 [Pleurodeles waltl]|uniref:Uncharacterized protein n=1 Tax=Pleurodeles waltl TaxID=8319 RepID=A0AAV7V3L5_PLEWA|nr:hypothetical protein NDU88_005300 [Pleurodeles waltl]